MYVKTFVENVINQIQNAYKCRCGVKGRCFKSKGLPSYLMAKYVRRKKIPGVTQRMVQMNGSLCIGWNVQVILHHIVTTQLKRRGIDARLPPLNTHSSMQSSTFGASTATSLFSVLYSSGNVYIMIGFLVGSTMLR